MDTEDFFGEVISSYSRAQAIEDGVLVDVSESAKGQFKFPVALTIALHSALTVGKGKEPATYSARLRDVFTMAISYAGAGEDVYYPVTVGSRTLRLRANCGPGDKAEPVLTIGFPEDF